MHVVTVNTKGGCGKTLLATQLACYYASSGKSVAIFDHDSQQSSKDWVKVRPKRCAPINAVAAYAGEMNNANADIVIHDMPAGYDIRDLQKDVPDVKKILIPIMPSPTDMRVVWRFCMMLSYTGLLESDIEVGFVVNRFRANASFNKVLMKFLNRLDVPVVGFIRDTQNYIHANNRGLGIFDLPKARTSVDRKSWESVIEWLQTTADESFAQQLMDDIVQKQLELV